MSHAPSLGASMTSSGFTDGLGRRSLGFDREEGTMLERLTVRPELAAFSNMLRERVERLSALEDERIARPRCIEEDSSGALVVVSEFVPGSRLSDLLDSSAEQGTAPGLDAAVGYLLDVLPALCGLHAGAGFAHGTIAPSRTILTPAGQVVLLDGIYGGALSLLRYSPRKLWAEFSVAVSSPGGGAQLGVDADIGQVAMSSVMLILGRPLYEDEFPDALPRVIADVIEIAQIRGTADFARGFRTFLERALPLPNRQPYTTADDALIELRELASELGQDTCRRALVDFIEQTEPPANLHGGEQPEFDEETGIDDVVAAISTFGVIETVEESDPFYFDEDEDEEIESEIDLEAMVGEPSSDSSGADEFETHPEVLANDRDQSESLNFARAREIHDDTRGPAIVQPATPTMVQASDPLTRTSIDNEPESASAEKTSLHEAPEELNQTFLTNVRSKRAKRTRSARARKDKLRSAATPTPLATQKTPAVSVKAVKVTVDEAIERTDRDVPEKIDPVDKKPAAANSEKSDKSNKSEPPAEDKRPNGGWLVAPGRAESFEPPVPGGPPAVPTIARPMVPVVAMPSVTQQPGAIHLPPPAPFASAPPFTPPPPAIAPPQIPIVQQVPVPTFGAPVPWSPQSTSLPPQIQPVTPSAPAPGATSPVKLKAPAPKPRPVRTPSPAEEIYGTPTVSQESKKSTFPLKLAGGAIAATLILIVLGRAYLPSGTTSSAMESVAEVAAVAGEATPTPRARGTSSAPTREATAGARGPAAAPAPAVVGRVEIETQPAGAQVTLDGKPVGASPLTLESVPAGRHTVTLTAASGTVKRLVRVEGGRTLKIDVPIFSGWVGIFAPFVVEVSEGGRVIGTTEESRLMLSPGRHVLTLVNRELGYRSTETVEIEPGEVRSVTLDPRGTVNLNASPWAEVWINGKKAGDTPLAGLQLPLGIQEVTFRHPALGERKVAVTVKGNQPAALSVNMTK